MTGDETQDVDADVPVDAGDGADAEIQPDDPAAAVPAVETSADPSATDDPAGANAAEPDEESARDERAASDGVSEPGEGSASDEPAAARGGSEADDEPAIDDGEADDEPAIEIVSITLNGRAIEAHKGELVIAAAERHGEYVPRFCYHPRMKSVGMCRQCMVEIDTGRGPMLQPSCMIPVAPDMVVETESDAAKRAQEGILELLLANHPLDCPVCDKGGECPLQDQAYSHGPGESRYVEQKRHYEKPIPISDHVLLDRERCILCDRCTRFADEVAGDKLIHFIDRGNLTQVNTFPDEPFASYFSGNTVQICPVGALTAEPYRFKARPWDLEQVTSTCTTCSVGCRISVHSSRDQVLRYQGIDVESVNWGWMCDRGRFNFEAVDSEHRIGEPLVRGEAGLEATSWASAMAIATQLIAEAGTIALLGGARCTNEGAFAWAKLADAAGVEHRDAQLGDGLPVDVLGLPRATITDAANAPTVILCGPDPKEELPVLYLRLRDAVQEGRTRVIEFSPVETGMTKYAWRSVRHVPGMAAAEIARTLATEEVAAQLGTGEVVVVAGRSNLAESEVAAMAAIRSLLDAVPGARVLPALRRGNVVGALQLGLAPPDAEHDAPATLRAAADGKVDLLILAGADPIADCPDADLARRAIAGARRVISIDTFQSASTARADVILPAAGFAEQTGTTTNLEGRVSRVSQKVTMYGTSRPDWMIAAELMVRLGHDLDVGDVHDLTERIAATVPAYAGVTPAAVDADLEGVLAVPAVGDLGPAEVVAEQRHGYDYRLIVSRKLYDRAVNTAMSPSLAGLAVGAGAHVNPADLTSIGESHGAEVKLVSASGSVVMPLVADGSVARGTVWAPFNQPGPEIAEIVAGDAVVTDVRIERVT